MMTRVRRLALVALFLSPAATADATGPRVRLELADGTQAEGELVEIGPAGLRLDGAATMPSDRVRTLTCTDAPGRPAAGRVRAALTDGTSLAADDFSAGDAAATLDVAEGRVEMPIGRVRSVDWQAEGVAWAETLPERAATDLVVVRKGEGFEFVECAITGVGPETVTVVLDGETIPVKRSKVLGVVWLRGAAAAPGGTAVDVAGGGLRADAVAWTPTALVLDADDAERRTVLPAAALRRIDYAAGRTVRLADTAPERLDVEPFFGALGAVEGLARFFEPRFLPADARSSRPGPQPGLSIRPRTTAVWRIPAGSRRFRARLAGDAAAGPASVAVAVDDRRVLEVVVSGPDEVPVDLDVDGGRRLGVTVDFGPGGALAGPVRFLEPVLEQ